MRGFRIFLWTITIIGCVVFMIAVVYADQNRVDGVVRWDAGIILLLAAIICGFPMAKAVLVLWITKDDK